LFDLQPLYSFFSSICHQAPTRSWHIHGEPLAVCIRCAAISLGFLTGLLALDRADAGRFKRALALTVLQWLLALAVLDSDFLRALSGALLGAAAAPLVRIGVGELIHRKVRTTHEPL
jgi:hypothetical protein